ncbi:efflux RND transporter periplasmic adaptor subunit [Nitrincola sp. MINF-07-Sa-05]|uniref:efflux RND transporter periplasmic adaptor subunit n=1 Tax=Nitrincola salilacus TaxID=3400273 RepID=UPI003917E43F
MTWRMAFALLALFGFAQKTVAADPWSARITVATVESVSERLVQQFAAEVVSLNHTFLASELAARIEQIQVRPGETVEQGQLLVRLDCRDTQAQQALLQARLRDIDAGLKRAERQAERLQGLQSRQLTDTSSLEDAQTDVERSRAQIEGVRVELALAERQIERCEIHAPFKATVLQQLTGEGQWVSPGTPLLELVQISPAEIEVQLPASLFLHNGNQWQVEFSATGISAQPVSLIRQSMMQDPRSRTVKTWFTAPENARIGMIGQLTIDHGVEYIPANLILRREGELGVFLIESDWPEFFPLVGAQEGRPFPAPPEWAQREIVISGHHRLPLQKEE